MAQIEICYLLSSCCHFRGVAQPGGQGGLHFLDEQEQSAEADLVPGGEQKVMDFGKGYL